MKLSILIVNWNTRDLVTRCINSILKNAPPFDYEVIVVDNYSQDGSLDHLTNFFGPNKKIHILGSLKNLGFAKASNWAYRNSSGEYIFLLNPDTELTPQALQNMVLYLEQHPEVGVLGPKLLNPDGSLQPSVRRFPGIFSSLLVFSGAHRWVRPRRYMADDFDYRNSADVDQVMGAALMTGRKIIELLGLFDEKFWLWYEEVDFCRRVKQAGFKVRFFPEAAIVHEGGQSFTQLPVYQRKRVVAKSLIYYFQKNGNAFQVFLIRLAMPVVLFAAKFLDFLQKVFGFKLKTHV